MVLKEFDQMNNHSQHIFNMTRNGQLTRLKILVRKKDGFFQNEKHVFLSQQ